MSITFSNGLSCNNCYEGLGFCKQCSTTLTETLEVLVLALTVIQEEVAAFPPSSWHHLSCADCLENKWGKLSELFFAVLCMTVMHHEWYTHMSSSYRWLLVLGLVCWATVCKMVHPMLSDHCPVCLSVTLVYCSQTVGWIKMKFGMEISLDPGHIVLGGDPAAPPPSKKGVQPPISGPCLLWPNSCPSQLLVSSCLFRFSMLSVFLF